MSKSFHFSIFVVFTLLLVLYTSCKKKNSIFGNNISFSTDTLVFDTVFTTIGSTTLNFKVYNKDNNDLNIESVSLAGGENSPFRFNFDGYKGTSAKNVTILANDSAFCFVEVTLKVNNTTNPLIIEDSLCFTVNGKKNYINLAVWGQDAYFHYNDLNEGIWPNDKPHVIYGYAAVDSAKSLIIQKKTKIHLHKKSLLFNYKGTLRLNGEKGEEIELLGDRLEQDYKNISGQYYGLYSDSPQLTYLNHVKIKNGTAGIHVFNSSKQTSPTVIVNNTEISNNSSYGVFLFDRANVQFNNTLIHKNGVHALLVLQGSQFQFNHCNILNYGDGEGTSSCLGIRNYFQSDGTTFVGNITNSSFTNCVIYGNAEKQLAFDTIQFENSKVEITFDHCVIRTPSQLHKFYKETQFDTDPLFNAPFNADYKFSPSSPLNNKGKAGILNTDILLNTRSTITPDIGVYELN